MGRKEEKTDIIKKGLIQDKLCLQGLEFGLLICMSYIFNDLNFIAFKCQFFLAKKKLKENSDTSRCVFPFQEESHM